MLRQSITWQLLLYLKSIWMQYEDSVFYRRIMALAARIRSVFSESALYHCVTQPSALEQKYKTSLFYAVLSAIYRGFVFCITTVRDWIGALSAGSTLQRILHKTRIAGVFKIEYLSAGFFALMLLTPHTLWNNLYALAGAVFLLVVYLLQLKTSAQPMRNVRGLPLSLLIFVLAIAFGVVITPVPADGVRIAMFYITAILFMLICAAGIRDKKALYAFLHLLLGGLGILCVFGIVQRFIGVEVSEEFTDLANNVGMPGRIFATLSNPNNYAEVIVMLTPFVGAMLLKTKSGRAKVLWSILLLLCVVALAMTYSRSCWVSFAIAVVVFFALYDWRLLLPLCLVAVLCLPLLPASVMNRILTIGSMTDTSNASRVFIWYGVADMLRDHGLTGIGLGSQVFTKMHELYAHPHAPVVQHSHMLYLELFTEMGILGGCSFLAFLLTTIKKGLASFNRTDYELRSLIIAGIASLAGICFAGAAEYIWFYPRVMFVFWIVMGILLCAIRLSKQEKGN